MVVVGSDVVEEMVGQLTLNRITTWSPEGLGTDDGSFDSIVQRLFELEVAGVTDVMSVSRDMLGGYRRVRAIKFARLR